MEVVRYFFIEKSEACIFIWEIASDHRPMFTWPPPDGHVATARWSLTKYR